jgi:AraC-like DNA-binding protein
MGGRAPGREPRARFIPGGCASVPAFCRAVPRRSPAVSPPHTVRPRARRTRQDTPGEAVQRYVGPNAKATPPRGAPDWLELARHLLHEHHGPGLRMRAIAGEVGVHPVHLSRAFRHHFGTTMSVYLRDLRVRRACEELRHTRHSLARIAIAVGFSDHAHFTRVFKETQGLIPTQYRGQSRPLSPGEAPRVRALAPSSQGAAPCTRLRPRA